MFLEESESDFVLLVFQVRREAVQHGEDVGRLGRSLARSRPNAGISQLWKRKNAYDCIHIEHYIILCEQ